MVGVICRQYMKWLLMVIGLFAVVGSVSIWALMQKNVIYIYDDYIEPSEITIGQGEQVTFVSRASREIWPASDAHPTHGVYSEFDPKGGILPGETWEFVFDQPGIWDFHDHLKAELTGKITVLGEFGSAARACVDLRSGTSRASCWETDFAKLIDEDGIDTALDKFVEFYESEPNFNSYCHDIMHYVGRASYEVYKLDKKTITRPETSYCGYGFYHGFVESAFEQESSAGLDVAKNYCSDLAQNPNFGSRHIVGPTVSACKHGIGHAIFDSLDAELWGDYKLMTDAGIATCENLYSDDEHSSVRCATGIYNSLTTALNNNYYYIDYPSAEEVVSFCTEQGDMYRPWCWVDMVPNYTKHYFYTLEERLDFAYKHIESKGGRELTVVSIVDDDFRSVEDPDINYYVSLCSSIEDGDLKFACLQGILGGVTYSSYTKNLASRLEEVCEVIEFDADFKQVCESQSFWRLTSVTPIDDLFDVCEENDLFGTICRQYDTWIERENNRQNR